MWVELASFAREFGRNFVAPGSSTRSQLDEARRLIYERRMEWNMTLQDYELNRDIRAAIERGDTPDSPAGQALVARWRDAIERFTAGDPKLRKALQLVMSDWKPGPTWSAGYRAYFDLALQGFVSR